MPRGEDQKLDDTNDPVEKERRTAVGDAAKTGAAGLTTAGSIPAR